MKPTLITGASGFLGWHVARKLLERGHRLRALVRPGSQVRELEVETVTGDLRDPESLEKAVSGCGAVFHVAADYRLWSRDSSAMYRSNVEGTRNMLAAAQGVGCGAGSLYEHGRLYRFPEGENRKRTNTGKDRGYARGVQTL